MASWTREVECPYVTKCGSMYLFSQLPTKNECDIGRSMNSQTTHTATIN